MRLNSTYGAFGELEGRSGSTENSYLFAGEQFDDKLGDYYLRQRYYSNSTGRFSRRDTFEGRFDEPLTLHKYLYSHSNPVNSIDPSGLSTLTLSEANATVLLLGTLAHTFNTMTRAYDPERLGGIGAGSRPSVSEHTGYGRLWNVLDFGRQVGGFGLGPQPSVPSSTANPGWQNTVDGLVSYVFNYDVAKDILLKPDGTPIGVRGSRDDIRELPGGFDAARETFDAPTQGGTVDTSSGYPGIWINRPNNGGSVGLREYASRSPGTEATVDINISGVPIKKLKFIP